MAQKTITTYDGIKYQKVVLEEVGNIGHYREISRTTETILGILDDTELLKSTIQTINNFRSQAGRFICLRGDGYFFLFTVIQIETNDFDNLAQGVLSLIETIGYVTAIDYSDAEKITFKLIDKATEEKEITLVLESYNDEIYQLKE